ncbi:OmpA/MotB family protein [Pseudodesulfovibrio tunisiensis]|uniref:OmpA/MotB family protein n=1 Tax=Pseudodesulfovibrio tunisiensis TaxID=463192 RepID=UPI001FB441BA|nr:flagellar motor protein MotB [Pseudodesulfovibrio tunisiensis]
MRVTGSFIPRTERPKQPDGWRLTLADMMTLLLCFFVLMFSVAEVDPARYSTMSEVLSSAMSGKEKTPRAVPAEQDGTMPERQGKNLFELQLELARLIGGEAPAISLKLRPDAVAVNLRGGVFFDLGSATLTPRAMDILSRLAGPLTEAHYRLTIEGHSDNLPIHSTQYPSNWELSSARASSVARYLIEHGFPGDDIQVMGLADTRPLAPNEDKAGKAIPDNQSKNRRVVILVKPAFVRISH